MLNIESLGRGEDDSLLIEVAQNSVAAFDYAYEAFKDRGDPEAELILQVLKEYTAGCLTPLTVDEREQILAGASHLSPEEIDANTRFINKPEQNREVEEE